MNRAIAQIPLCFYMLTLMTGQCATNVLPGVRIESYPSGMSGSLVFLYSTNWHWSGGAGQIYELSLKNLSLRSVTTCPTGDFYAAKDGKTFCVLHGANVGWGIFGTNAFMYSERLRLSRSYTFQKRPANVTLGNDHVFFFFENRILDYDMREAVLKSAPFPGTQPEDNAEGGLSDPVTKVNTNYGGLQTSDGRWIYFEGADAPLRGTKLVASPLDEFETRTNDPKGKNIRVLKRFSHPLQGSYNLTQLSPCGRYAFVRKSVPINDGWGFTYYVVDVGNGKTTMLVEDTVSKFHASRVSQLYWVGRHDER